MDMKFKLWLTEATKEDFWNLANLQRDKPERAMLKVQFVMMGGIMNSAAEHIGDLTHRMAERPTFSTAGYEFVKEKVIKTLDWLTNEYGFEREFEENIKNNARFAKVDEQELRANVYAALEAYAQEHEKLPTYNKAQHMAKMAAVHLGRRNFLSSTICLRQLKSHLGSREDWIKYAHEGLEVT